MSKRLLTAGLALFDAIVLSHLLILAVRMLRVDIFFVFFSLR